jgi:LPS-assembly lipoprotein
MAVGALARVVLLLAAASLSACGLHPLYGRNSVGASVADTLATIEVGVIPDRSGQILRNVLITKLNPDGRPEAPAYLLRVQLTELQTGVSFESDQGVTRRNLSVNARYTLTTTDGRNPVFSDTVSETTSYNVLHDEFMTEAGERDARERALTALGDDIRLRIALYFDRAATARAAAPATEPPPATPPAAPAE